MVNIVHAKVVYLTTLESDDACMGPLRFHERRCMVEVTRLSLAQSK